MAELGELNASNKLTESLADRVAGSTLARTAVMRHTITHPGNDSARTILAYLDPLSARRELNQGVRVPSRDV